MARIKNGLLGGFSGKAGAIIGYQFRGKDFIRGLPRISNKAPSEKQLASRAKFKALQNWRSYLTDFFAVSFKNHTHERSAQNAAHHFNAKIIIGEYPDYVIDYPSIVISEGSLPPLANITMELTDGLLSLTWSKEIADQAKNRDLVALLVLYENSNWMQGDLAIADRYNGKCNFKLDYKLSHEIAHIYLTVLSNDRTKAANSVYLGNLVLTPL
ncbi:MAG: hypothetical protein EOP00_01705 [Pedobacter sp.]|nr:MAG: hypothetical protein EOP00_01705 [Pedobacter sp.]